MTEIPDLKSFFRENGIKYRESGGEIQIISVWRGGQGYNTSINPRSGRWFDYVTNQGGKFETLIKLIDGTYDGDFQFEPPDEPLELPKTFDKNILNDLKKENNYWLNRGISQNILDNLDFGSLDDPKMANRSTFVIWDKNRKNIHGLVGRTLVGAENKWKILGTKTNFEYPLYFNFENIKQKKEIILVESIGDYLSAATAGFNNCLVLFGTNLSAHLLSTIISLNPSFVKLCLNFDENAAGQTATEKIIKKLVKFFDPAQIKVLNPKPFNDLNDALVSGGSEFVKNLLN